MALPIKWSLRAAKQFDAICEYIAFDSPRYACIVARNINRIIKSIPDSPRRGRIVPEFGDEQLRERIYQSYRIVYRISKASIEIVLIFHGARRIRNVMEEE